MNDVNRNISSFLIRPLLAPEGLTGHSGPVQPLTDSKTHQEFDLCLLFHSGLFSSYLCTFMKWNLKVPPGYTKELFIS